MSTGFRICVPASTLAAVTVLMLGFSAPAGAAECPGNYTVQPGDTLSRVAARCDSSVEALISANPQITSPSRLSVGWKLVVPGRSSDSGAQQVSAIPEKDDPVLLQGWIVNGQRCAMLETEDGQEYGVVSPELSFVSGSAVSVAGRMVDDPSCSGPRTLLVTELNTSQL